MINDQFIPRSVNYISGKTRLFAIVGNPITQVRSPEFITYELVARGLDAIVLPLHLTPDRFDALFPAMMAIENLDGLIITVPYKGRATPFMDRLGPQAEVTRTVSVLSKRRDGWIGEMFDGLGCVSALQRRGVSIAGGRILLLGAGGAGSAIAVALASQAPRSLRIVDPDGARAAASAQTIRQAFPDLDVATADPQLDLNDTDIVINASPVGMLNGEACPLQMASLPSHLTVMDIVMKPDDTRLLSMAAAAGCTVVYGREMLGSQASAVVDFLTTA
ncbi:MAG: shikimate dehydrogenase [Pseudomonadota bacterium]